MTEALRSAGWPIRPGHDPDAAAMVSAKQSGGAPALWQRGVADARAYIAQRAAAAPPGPEIDHIDDVTVPHGDAQVPIRIYRPSAVALMPAVVYLHGGGWVLGDVASSDAFCRRLAHAARSAVFAVDYRLAPEHPFPAARDDSRAALGWVSEHAADFGADPEQLVLLGDSAGGNLATITARDAATDGITVRRQILAYPVVAGDAPFPDEYDAAVWPLTEGDRRWFVQSYVPHNVSPMHPDIAPLHGDVTGMPPTTLLLGGCDPLFGEGMAYAAHLIEAGVQLDLHVYAGQFHGFLSIDDTFLPTSRQALGVVVNAIREGRPR